MSEQAALAPEFGSRPEDLSVFNEAVGAVRLHNEQFGLGKLMARAMVDHLEEVQHAQELSEAGATPEEAEETAAFVGNDKVPLSEEEQMARAVVGVTAMPALEGAGLTLSPLRTTSTMYSSKGEQSVGQVRLQVTDGGKFSGFLLAAKTTDVTKDFQKNAASVTDNLVAEASDAVASDVDERTTIETLAYGKGIVAGLEHIGLAESPVAQKLTALAEHAQQGDVKEFVLADRAGLLTEPSEQGFSPAQWQRDASPDFLKDSWGNVLNVLKMAKDNPKAKELFAQLLQSAQSNLEYAKGDWQSLKEKNYGGGNGYGAGFEDVFQTVELELSILASPDEEVK